MYTYTYVCMYACMYVRMYTYIYIYIYMYKHSFHVSPGNKIQQQKLQSSPRFGAFKADFPTCLLIRRSVFFSPNQTEPRRVRKNEGRTASNQEKQLSEPNRTNSFTKSPEPKRNHTEPVPSRSMLVRSWSTLQTWASSLGLTPETPTAPNSNSNGNGNGNGNSNGNIQD